MLYPFKILNKKKYSLCFLNAFIENLCIYLLPLILSLFLTQPFNTNKFFWLIFFTLLLEAIKITCNVIWNIKASPFIQTSKKDLQMAYFQRICQMDIVQINKTHTGYLKKQIEIISENTTNVLEELMMTINGFTIAVTIFLIQVYTQSVAIFVVCIVFIILIVIYNIIISHATIKVQQNYNDKDAQFNASAIDFLQNVKTIKNTDSQSYATTVMESKFDQVKKPLKKTFCFYSLRVDGINIMMYIMYAIILISLFIKLSHGGNVFNYLVFYTAIFGNLRSELKGVARLFLHLNKFSSANKQIENMLIEGNALEKIQDWDNITMQNIRFNHENENNTTIQIPKFSINRKDKISITGESGQGKTTTLALFCRNYTIKDKHYLVNGEPSQSAPDVAYISQETELFDLSIKDNLCLGKKIDDATLTSYLTDAGLMEWVNSLEDGWDTLVGEKGVKLSAGQKQRLNFIRGVILDKEIYILDEPTSNLDDETENKIYQMVTKYLTEKTCIIVTHRPKLVEFCNLHYQFENKVLSLSAKK